LPVMYGRSPRTASMKQRRAKTVPPASRFRADVSRERTADLYNLQRLALAEGDGNVAPARAPRGGTGRASSLGRSAGAEGGRMNRDTLNGRRRQLKGKVRKQGG